MGARLMRPVDRNAANAASGVAIVLLFAGRVLWWSAVCCLAGDGWRFCGGWWLKKNYDGKVDDTSDQRQPLSTLALPPPPPLFGRSLDPTITTTVHHAISQDTSNDRPQATYFVSDASCSSEICRLHKLLSK